MIAMGLDFTLSAKQRTNLQIISRILSEFLSKIFPPLNT
jgi:hypothetical protein